MLFAFASLLVLIGLHKVKGKFGSTCNFVLHRDDGLGIYKVSSRQTELINKDLCGTGVLSSVIKGLKIIIEANRKPVNFLDVTLNLVQWEVHGLHQTRKSLYVNKKSNHPPRIVENIPQSIDKRLFQNSIDEHTSNEAAPLYQKALDDSGYYHLLTFTPGNVFELHQKPEKLQKHY